MKKLFQIALTLAALLSINASATFAQTNIEAGTYRSQTATVGTDERNKIVRVLRLREDGSAELVSRYRGAEPVVNAGSLQRHGNLLRLLRDRQKVYHEGTWSSSRGRIDVVLTRAEGTNVQSRSTFQLRGNSLTAVAWDRLNYGSAGFRFLRIEGDDEDDDQPAPASFNLNLSDRGYGSLQIGRDSVRDIERATVVSGANGQTEINLIGASGPNIRLTGKVVRQDNSAADLSLSNSGQANASGTLTVEPGAGNTIKRLTGRGRIDGRDFTLSFRGESVGGDSGSGQSAGGYETLNYNQRGRGLYAQDGQRSLNITSVSVQSRANGDIEVALIFSDRNRRLFTGKINFSDFYSVVVSPDNSGQSQASGSISIDFGDDNSINSVTGDGKIDNSRFSIQFRK